MKRKTKYSGPQDTDNVKFMQTLGRSIFKELKILAIKRDVTVQEYIRVIVIPDHLTSLPKPIKKYSKRAKKAWATRRKRTQSLDKAIEFIKKNEVPTAPEMPKQ